MPTTAATARIIGGALLSGALGVTVLGLAAGTARATGGPFQWCPGQPLPRQTSPIVWDMNVCHTWYAVAYGEGNVPRSDGGPSSIWEGPDPPNNPPSSNCGLFWCPVPPHY
ncbi:hypothetical protein [Mycobacterium sp. Marseille-P9652]|uniref:hypothetical protein n=1 Tax=Mycobacterium sp. Marseille-P9652 TaxID=2654950 RepID=UPI001E505A28|nr:hypothetical protein [Mycobacterium sp. Marseille-P9652]